MKKIDEFYAEFEERFRGPFNVIYDRLLAYKDGIIKLFNGLSDAKALDLGCGRGEWLTLLKDIGIHATGVDTNENSIIAAKQRGLTVEKQDLFAKLEVTGDCTFRLISAFHVIEHLPWERQLEFFFQAYRCLEPGGVLLLEWPNAKHIDVSTYNFWLDPTHIRPVPSELIAFMAEFSGFDHLQIQARNNGFDVSIICLKKSGEIPQNKQKKILVENVSRKFRNGVNVIGHISGNLGLGVFARHVIAHLKSRGVPISTLDIDPGYNRADMESSSDGGIHRVTSARDLPHDINLFVLAPETIGFLTSNIGNELRCKERFNAGLIFWELPNVPETWHRSLQALDLVLAPSPFIHAAFSFSCPGPMLAPAKVPIALPSWQKKARSELGLPEQGVLFLTAFEPLSDPVRKNVEGTINAFCMAIEKDNNDTWLVIKVNNSESGQAQGILRSLNNLIQSHPRIKIVRETLSYDVMLSLIDACDVFVSLHKAEGFGLGPFEAMALGKPVIATAWSGNMAYMDARSACLVNYQLVEACGLLQAYRQPIIPEGTRWAEPDLTEAAQWMKFLASNSEERKNIGQCARERIDYWNKTASDEDFWGEVEALANQEKTVRHKREAQLHQISKQMVQPWLPATRWLPGERDWAQQAMDAWRLGGVPAPTITLVLLLHSSLSAQPTRDSLVTQWHAAQSLDEVSASTDSVGLLALASSTLLSSGAEWLGLVDAGDQLAPDALFRIAHAVREHPEWQVVYTDEDNLTPDGQHVNPH